METIKRQSKKIGVAGGFINQMMGNNYTTPIVGQGATELMYSDRKPYEVISVTKDGLECVIREMDTKWISGSYGDEKYIYNSNPKNETKTLVWKENKNSWYSVRYQIEIIKSLSKKLEKQFGWGNVIHNLPNGLTVKDIRNENDWINGDSNLKLIDGVTKEYKYFDKFSVIFGISEKYTDPSF